MSYRNIEPGESASRLHLPDWALYSLMAVFVLLVIGIAYATFAAVKNFVAEAPIDVLDQPITGDPAAQGEAESSEQGAGSAEDLPLNIDSRITVLVMGIDERKSQQGPWRTDTMIILTIDPINNTAGMLSIPRDTWVEIPNYDGVFDRINTANFRGDADNYPGGGGPALAMETVRQNFGVPVDYFVTVNFNAFVEIIGYLDCVPISVPENIDDPTYPESDGTGYDPFYIEAGDHCMDGETLLKYARTRATYGGDFDRAARQQQVIHAIRDHILTTNQLTNLLAQAPEIYASVQDDINTNLSVNQLISLARLASEIPEEAICSRVIDGAFVDLATLPDGSQVLVPDRTRVRTLVQEIFTATGQCDPAFVDLAVQSATEGAAVSVINGTTTEGLATSTGDKLAAAGISIASVGNADRFDYESTIIYSYTGKIYTARYIAQLLGISESAIVEMTSPGGGADIEVILGGDYRP